MNDNTLWMGDIEYWMDEKFVIKLFAFIAPIKSVKVMKKNGQSIGYGFLEFSDEKIASFVLNNYNGKLVPGYNRPLKLSRAQFNGTKLGEEEVQIYVCDMELNINEDQLRSVFKAKYPSVVSAKIICDPLTRISKGYGFVKFKSNEEANKAVKEMNGFVLEGKPIRIK